MVSLNKEYIAGLFDADGCISMYNAGRKEKRINRLINIKNFSPKAFDLVRSIRDTLGYGLITKEKDTNGYNYFISRKEHILSFCEDVGKFLVIKKKQSELMAEACKLIFGHPTSDNYKEVKKENNRLIEELRKEKNNNETIDFSRSPDISWLAGMLDGDGHLAFSKAVQEDRNFPFYNRYMSIVVMNKVLVDKLAKRFCGTVRVDSYYNEIKPLISLEIKTRRYLKAALEEMLPYLFLKREKALLILCSLEIIPTKKGVYNNPVYTDSERLHLDNLYNQFKDI